MKTKKRDVAGEIIADLKGLHATIAAGIAPQRKYTVHTVRIIPDPGKYRAVDVRKTRALVGASQPVFARMLGVSAALVRAWECGARKPAPLARRLLDVVRSDPSRWRAMIEAA